MTMGMRIKNLRKMRGLTQEALGERLFVDKATISQWEHDLTDIRSSYIRSLAKALGTIPGYFFITDDKAANPDEASMLLSGISDPKLRQAAIDHMLITCRVDDLIQKEC